MSENIGNENIENKPTTYDDSISTEQCEDTVIQDSANCTTIIPDECVKTSIGLDTRYRIIPLIILGIGAIIMILQWALSLTIMTLIGAVYMCFVSAGIAIDIIVRKRVSLWPLVGYALVNFGIMSFYIVSGADAGWGAFTSTLTGFASGDFALWQGTGNFGTRLAGNVLLSGPAFLLLIGMIVISSKWKSGNIQIKNTLVTGTSVLLVGMSVGFVFIMNLRAAPQVFDMQEGHDDYLGNISDTSKSGSPNVLVVMMDDLGYGDTSYNARKANITPSFETPNIDSIAEGGLDFDNFYSSYSVCSPARFSMMTGRYPYRGHADNVLYPTVNSLSPFASTRVFNSFEMGANVDGMLGDEVTMAEMFSSAGYATGAFGKWHMGDYGEYLPTNQGFDYFYGSHHVNDMTPYYQAREVGGEYDIIVGTETLDQRDTSKQIHEETESWITQKAENDENFFAYYATPWPHGPVYAGDDFAGSTGAGIYADCITEFDYYLGELFDTMEELGVLDDTLIVFTSDNGPALEGSSNENRGGKYSAYDAGQKIPTYMRWDNNPLFSNDPTDKKARTIHAPATLVDLFPTFAEVCGISDKAGQYENGYLPSHVDRAIDGVSMMPLIEDYTNSTIIHTKNNPILHMKREKIMAVQYGMTKQEVLDSVKGYTESNTATLQTNNESFYHEMPFIKDNSYTTWKFFENMKNDNPEFFNKRRKDWLFCLTDDSSESYQRARVFPTIAQEAKQVMHDTADSFKENRRGIKTGYYND